MRRKKFKKKEKRKYKKVLMVEAPNEHTKVKFKMYFLYELKN